MKLHSIAVIAASLAVSILAVGAASQFAAAADPPERMELNGKQFIRAEGKWFLETPAARRFEVVPEVVTVKFRRGLAEPSTSQFLRAKNVRKLRANHLGVVDISVPPGMDAVTFVAQLQQEADIEYAEVNTYGEYLQFIPDDTRFDELWGLDNTGQTGGTADADIDAPEAWDLEKGDGTVVVAVLDSGVEYDHEDLECNIYVNPGEDLDMDGVVWDTDDLNGVDDDGNGFIDDLIGWDFAGPDNDPRPTYSHGSHVAGIVAACGNNATGVIGVAGGDGPGTGARLMPLLVGNAAPDGSILDDAILFAADNGARVITMSLSVGESQAIKDALTYAYDTMGVFINNASGNANSAVEFPATDPHVMAVGATDDDDLRADFAGWGSNFGPELEVVAPGVDSLSTEIGNTYNSGGGTSYASPHVAGTAALMFSRNPPVTNQEVRDCITDTAEDEVGDPTEDTAGRDDYYGFGRLNAADALDCIGALNYPPVCDANGPYVAECGLPVMLNGTGSYDPDADPITYLWTGPFTPSPSMSPAPTVSFPAPTGLKDAFLTVTDPFGEEDSCTAVVTVEDTLDPDITAPPDRTAECTSPDGTPVDLGTPTVFDYCDASPAVSNDAPAVFSLGTTTVTWTATDADTNSASDIQSVLVEDTTPPTAYCNSPASITPPDAPISFTATATDVCGTVDVQIVGYDCYAYTKKGKRIDKTYSCQVAFGGDTITVYDSGGVGDNIVWTVQATDESGNTTSRDCALTVVNPAK
jgi:subtilisin family serine protease